MASRGWHLQVPRPKTFLGLISLQTGTEVITLTLIINKLTGFYGLLAILTGYAITLTQLSMYIYSLLVLLSLVVIYPHIRRQSAFECLGLAWLYIIDTILNAAYTAVFAVAWFAKSSALERNPHTSSVEESRDIPEQVLAGGVPVVPDVPQSTKHIGPEESWTSLGLVVFVTVVRVYFALVVMTYAQQVLNRRRHGGEGWAPEPEDGGSGSKEGLFAVGTLEGAGWRGRLGRRMLATGRGYWLDERAQEEWAKNMSSKFRSAGAAAHV